MLGAICWLAAAVGVKVGRAREARARAGVDPKYVARLESYVRSTLTPSASLDMGDMIVLPEPLKAEGSKLLHEARGAAERRAAYRGRPKY